MKGWGNETYSWDSIASLSFIMISFSLFKFKFVCKIFFVAAANVSVVTIDSAYNKKN